MSDPDNEDFVRRLVAGEHAAFAELVKRYHLRLTGFAGSLVGREAADDVLQEAWVSIWRGLPGYGGRAALKTWLYTIVRNECIARIRRDNRVKTVNVDTELHDEGFDAWLAANFQADGHWQGAQAYWTLDSPERLLEEAQLRKCIEHHVEGLQALQRSVFRLRDLEHLGLADICNILELSDSNVRVLLHRARLRLLQVVDRYQETGEC